MDERSEEQLAEVCPQLAEKVRAAALRLEAQGTCLLVVSGLRTAAQQDALFAQGRTAPGHVVTNARAGLSMHNYGLAVDVVPYLTGSSGALNWVTTTPQYRAMVDALKQEGLAWGGDWIHFPDMDHFQLGGLPANPSMEMMTAYAGGATPLQTLWKEFAPQAA